MQRRERCCVSSLLSLACSCPYQPVTRRGLKVCRVSSVEELREYMPRVKSESMRHDELVEGVVSTLEKATHPGPTGRRLGLTPTDEEATTRGRKNVQHIGGSTYDP